MPRCWQPSAICCCLANILILNPECAGTGGARAQIAQKTLAGPEPDEGETYRQQLAMWLERQNRLEAELASQIPEMNLELRLRSVDAQAVAQALPRNSTLVEFVGCFVFDFEAVPARGDPQWKKPHYLAFILLAEKPDAVQMIDLGEAERIDDLIEAFRAGIDARGGRHIGAAVEAAREIDPQAGIDVRKVVFDPLLPGRLVSESACLSRRMSILRAYRLRRSQPTMANG